MVEVRIPNLGESVTEGTIVRWLKNGGDVVGPDDPVLELETDKASLEIPAGAAGVLRILKQAGETVAVNDLVARIEDAGSQAARPPEPSAKPAEPPVKTAPPAAREVVNLEAAAEQETIEPPPAAVGPLSPAVRKLLTENRLDPAAIRASGKGGRLTKEDVLAHLSGDSGRAATPAPAIRVVEAAPRPAPAPKAPTTLREGEERVPMGPIRKRIAERLVQAQRTAAILTTFNEVDMSAVMALRARMKERFQQAHGVGLGFMSFFARATITALRDFPVVNAEIRGDEIVYKHFVNLGIAVSTERGLVVPVIHHAERLSFAEIEREVERLATRAREGKLAIDDLSGGTFTITNGGVYGSLLSTPILNPPQSGILGMHKIQTRPVIVDDQVVARPMMYLALSYDHRLVDGEQAVRFLVRVKERIEDPDRLLLEV